MVPYLPYRAEFVKNFQSQLSVFSETSKSVPSSSSNDQLSEKNSRKLVAAIKGSDLLPLKISQNRGLVNTFTKIQADLQQNTDMLSFGTTGETEMNAFIKSRVIGTPLTDAPVRRNNLKVFKDGKKKRQNKKK